MKSALPNQIKRAAYLAAEKEASSWLTVILVKDVDFTLNKREFKDANGVFPSISPSISDMIGK